MRRLLLRGPRSQWCDFSSARFGSRRSALKTIHWIVLAGSASRASPSAMTCGAAAIEAPHPEVYRQLAIDPVGMHPIRNRRQGLGLLHDIGGGLVEPLIAG